MKFIFPKNYSFKYKLLGFIDYTTAIIATILGFVLYFVLDIFIKSFTTKLYIFVIIFFPIILFSIFGLGKENLLSVTHYIFNFLKNKNVYLYNKNNSHTATTYEQFINKIIRLLS